MASRTGRGANLASWNNRANMVFANNVVYSSNAPSVVFTAGSAGVQVSGNVRFGGLSGVSAGFVQGTGLSDFTAVA